MVLNPGQTVELRDAKQRLLGHVLVESTNADLVSGSFRAGPDFAAVEPIFRDFEAAVDSQALAVVDKLDAAIAVLGLSLAFTGHNEALTIHDAQIWRDGGFSCRPVAATDSSVNGASSVKATSSARTPS